MDGFDGWPRVVWRRALGGQCAAAPDQREAQQSKLQQRVNFYAVIFGWHRFSLLSALLLQQI